jgi:hypothetical protein
MQHYIMKTVVLLLCVSKSFRNGLLEWELQMVQLSATRCSYIAILWVSLVNFAAITLCVASQQVFIVVVYFLIDSVRKLLDTPSYTHNINISCCVTQVSVSNMNSFLFYIVLCDFHSSCWFPRGWQLVQLPRLMTACVREVSVVTMKCWRHASR